MNIYQPYTYLIKFKPTGQFYYGASYANSGKKVANPEQFWNTYFTSSSYIKDLVKEHGKDAFEFQVRKVFERADQALKCEKKVLTTFDAKFNSSWLNKSNGYGSTGFTKHTEETKEKISKANKGRKLPTKTKEHREKLSNALKGKKVLTPEHKEKLLKANTGRKMPDHVKEKLIAISKTRIFSDEARKKMSDAAKGRIPWNKGLKTKS
jgi:hypothetical protein